MKTALLQALLVTSFLVGVAQSQASLATLGGGILDSSYFNRGGLVFPNPDGSGPQADSLAAAIYGVAVPPRFGEFAASENFFGNSPYSGLGGPAKPADLLVGTGIHHSPGQGGQQFSSYVTDFSNFAGGSADYLSPQPNNDLSSSSSSAGPLYIDSIAARFGVVVPSDNNQGGLFHPSLSGSDESLAVRSTVDTGTNEFVGVSPVQLSIQFDLPIDKKFSETRGLSLENNHIGSPSNTNLDSGDNSPKELQTPPADFALDPTHLDADRVGGGNRPIDVVTSAFKYSDNQLAKTEELNRNFQQATGKFSAAISAANFNVDDGRPQHSGEDSINRFEQRTPGHQGERPPTFSEPKEHPHPHPAHPPRPIHGPPHLEHQQRPPAPTSSPSPYLYRGGIHRDHEREHDRERERFHAHHSTLSATVVSPNENSKFVESQSAKKQRIDHRHPYSFITAAGYMTQ